MIAIGVTATPIFVRLTRGQTLAAKVEDYVEAARAVGNPHWRIALRHVLPNVMPLVLANTTLAVSISILSETTLSFLGLGDPTAVSWGTILEEGFQSGAVSQGAWWYIGPPGLCVVLVVLSFNLMGRAIEGILDPRAES